jgi:hypothetical protein
MRPGIRGERGFEEWMKNLLPLQGGDADPNEPAGRKFLHLKSRYQKYEYPG